MSWQVTLWLWGLTWQAHQRRLQQLLLLLFAHSIYTGWSGEAPSPVHWLGMNMCSCLPCSWALTRMIQSGGKGKKTNLTKFFRNTKKPQWLNASFNGKQINCGLEHRLWDGKGPLFCPLFSEKPHSKQENHETKTRSPSLILSEDVYQPKPQYMKMGSRWGRINRLAD